MSGLIPFNRKQSNLARAGANFEDFYNMLDDFFSDGLMQNRNLLRDTFKIDIVEHEKEYAIEAELPGINKEEIDLNVEDETLTISVNRSEETKDEGKNYIHRERRVSSMVRRVRLANAKLDDITARLEEGVLIVTIPKDIKTVTSKKIDIN